MLATNLFIRADNHCLPLKSGRLLGRARKRVFVGDVLGGGGEIMKRLPTEEVENTGNLPDGVREAIRKAVELTGSLPIPPHYDRSYWHEERTAIASLAAWEALISYNTDCGVPMETYVFLRARWAILDEWKRLYRWGKNLEAYPIDEETGEEMEFEDPYAEQSIESHLLCCLVREAMNQLSEGQQVILEMYYGENLSVREIAEQLGLSKSRVHREIRSAVEAIRNTLKTQHSEHE